MLKSILNSIEATSGEDNRRRTGRLQGRKEPTEQTFNLRILCEKYVQHQQDLYHVFIDFKKALDRVWHAALWATMKNTRSAPTSMTRPLVPSSSTAAEETGSEKQLESDRDVYTHSPSSTYFWKGS